MKVKAECALSTGTDWFPLKRMEDGGKKAAVLSGLDKQRHLDYGGKYSKTHLPQNVVRALGHLSISCEAHVSVTSAAKQGRQHLAMTVVRKLNYRDAEKPHSSFNRGGEDKGN